MRDPACDRREREGYSIIVDFFVGPQRREESSVPAEEPDWVYAWLMMPPGRVHTATIAWSNEDALTSLVKHHRLPEKSWSWVRGRGHTARAARRGAARHSAVTVEKDQFIHTLILWDPGSRQPPSLWPPYYA